MDLADVMDAIAARLDTIDGLTVFASPADAIHPPVAIVSYPDTITFDETYGRGMDRMDLAVAVLVGKNDKLSARNTLGAYCDGTGAKSVKTVLESGTYTAFHMVRVQSIDFDDVSVAGVEYTAALFALDITGSGS
jgi:hypothetical protein